MLEGLRYNFVRFPLDSLGCNKPLQSIECNHSYSSGFSLLIVCKVEDEYILYRLLRKDIVNKKIKINKEDRNVDIKLMEKE